MNPKKRRILSLSRIKKEDQYLKKLLICLKNSLKIFSVILVLSSATADDTGMVYTIPHSKYSKHTKRL